ncbi:Cna B-type domain-containing protein [Streptococcus henryi]|uniref:Cna B-type domain-containing protein n=1 Tax=Streptococcus henryi TaxID=439219 RepID=UPI000362E7D6|nr:Cna B-type domain-containing protein [Streptococcus henryi]
METRKWLSKLVGLLVLVLAIVGFQQSSVYAQEDSTAVLTVIKLKNSQGTPDDHKTAPVPGSFYTLIKLDNNSELTEERQKQLETDMAEKTVEDLEKLAIDNLVYHGEATDPEGATVFSNLSAGTYYGFEVNSKAGKERLATSQPFVVLVTLGSKLTVYPKTKEEPQPGRTTFTVRKVWKGQKLTSVTVNLKRDGNKIDSVELNANNKWEYTFENLEITSSEGKEYTYTVEEEIPKNYTATYTQMKDKLGTTITNTYVPPKKPKTPIFKTGTLGIYWLLGIAVIMIGLGYRFYKTDKK